MYKNEKKMYKNTTKNMILSTTLDGDLNIMYWITICEMYKGLHKVKKQFRE